LAEREARREDGLVEKSRDTGASWLGVAYALHGWLFRPGFVAGFGSRKLEYVDQRGNPKSIFEKARILLTNLPPWMLPRGFRWREHSGHAKLVNPETGAVLTGEGGDDIGRGDRTAIYFVDEAAWLEHPELADRALSQTTNVRIDVSTPNGPGNPFATKRFGGKVPIFTLHWRDDPRKGEAWYAYQKEVKYAHDPAGLAQEVDIDYTASLEGICIPAAWVRGAVGLELPASGPVVAGLDVAEEGGNQTVLLTRQGPVVRRLVAWGGCNTTETAWRARDEAAAQGVARLHYDCAGVGAGVKGAWDTAGGPLPFRHYAVNAGESPTDAVWPDRKTSRDKFANLRAELWWKVRCRFERAYEYREKGVKHPPEDMISIPDDPQLIAELSSALVEHTDTGKVQVESKKKMRARGVKSPDRADALVLSFSEPPRGIFSEEDLDRAFAAERPGLWPDGIPEGS
jgi:phage terminase large subunit